jgi:tetratricopeptide (TPR) repeat protein
MRRLPSRLQQPGQAETKTQTGLELFMAWFNLGTSRVKLLDYIGATDAYHYAYQNLYQQIPEAQRPFRMLWYQTGPYFAYYYTGNYPDLMASANATIETANSNGKPYIEESWYWRGMAELAMGDQSAAIDDLRQAVVYHPGFAPATAKLEELGVPLQ